MAVRGTDGSAPGSIIAFLMSQSGEWHLAPAFDVIYSYNPDGQWTSRHPMTLTGKREDFAGRDPRFPSPNGAAYVSPGQRPGYEIPFLSEAL